jgi:hypothetical protein
MYVETLTKLGLTKTQLRHSAVTFYRVVPGRQAKSLGSITLKVAFGSEENYREEPITFEVVPFKSTYHVIFGRPAFHSFHARPCYIYNQLKMPGLDGIITIYGSFRKAKECEEGEAAFVEAVFFGEEFKEIHAAMDPVEMPASKQEVSASAHLQAYSLYKIGGTCRWRCRQDHLHRDKSVPQIGKRAH